MALNDSSVPALTQPGSVAPIINVMPNTGAPVRSATEQASDNARATLAASGSALPADPGGQARVPAGTPPGGQFASTKEIGGTPAPEGAPAPGLTPPAPVEGVPAIEAPPEGGAPAEGDGTDEVTGEPIEDPLTVLLPGREGDEEFEFKVDSPEAADRLRQLKNGYMRGNAVREAQADAVAKLEQAQGVQQMLDYDPAGFVSDHILPENPDAVDHLILYTLTQPEVFKRLAPRLDKLLTDATEFRTVAAEQKALRAETRESVQTRMAEDRAVTANLRDVQATVAAILPPNLTPEQRQVLHSDCIRDLSEYATRGRMLTLPVHDIPAILARRLTANGINPVEAATRAAEAAVRNADSYGPDGRHPAPRAGVPQRPAKPAAAPPAPAAKPGGKTFVASAQRRVAAGAIPPAGAGSPAGGTPAFTARKSDGSVMTTAEALAAHRARLASGIKSY